MPLVVVTTDKGLLKDDSTFLFVSDLRNIVAEELNAPEDEGGQLYPHEIEVRFRENGPRDHNATPFAVEIMAHDFPSRRANLKDRVKRIAQRLRTNPAVPRWVVDEKEGFVWVLLAQGAFEKL